MSTSGRAETTTALFRNSVARGGDRCALKVKVGKEWQEISWAEFARRVDATAAALAARGIQRGDRVGIVSENCPDWIIADLAHATLGVTTVGIYPTLPPPQIAYILNDCTARAIFCQDKKQLDKVLSVKAEVPSLESVWVFEGEHATEDAPSAESLRAEGAGKTPPAVDLHGEDIAVLIYTSGTTGDPKGAMLSHWNLASNAQYTLEALEQGGITVGPDDRFLSFLPLAHSFERMIHLLGIAAGSMIAYSGGVRTLMDEFATIQPTLMGCVPRVFEAIQERIVDGAAKLPDTKRHAFNKALEVGRAVVEAQQSGRGPGTALKLEYALFDKLVFSQIRERFGGSFRGFISGGAALNPETARFYAAIGLRLLEGYGLTETSPVISINPASRPKIGTVGLVIPHGEVKIADDGEICYRGPNVMKGYWKNPEATAAMIDGDGWLHTGDVGELVDGYLKITDRKKDIIVLANGKNVSPLPIESALKRSPFISEVCLIGDKQNVVTALVLPNKERLAAWATEQGLTFADDAALVALPEAKKKIKAEIDANSTALADFEKIRRFTLLDVTFSIEGGELTPKMSVKRKVVAQKYAKEIAEMRGDD